MEVWGVGSVMRCGEWWGVRRQSDNGADFIGPEAAKWIHSEDPGVTNPECRCSGASQTNGASAGYNAWNLM